MSTTTIDPTVETETTAVETDAEPTPTTDAGGAGEGADTPKGSGPEEASWPLGDELQAWFNTTRESRFENMFGGELDLEELRQLISKEIDTIVEYAVAKTWEQARHDTLCEAGVHEVDIAPGAIGYAINVKKIVKSPLVHSLWGAINSSPRLVEQMTEAQVHGAGDAIVIDGVGAGIELGSKDGLDTLRSIVHREWQGLLDKAIAEGAPADVIENYRSKVEETKPV